MKFLFCLALVLAISVVAIDGGECGHPDCYRDDFGLCCGFFVGRDDILGCCSEGQVCDDPVQNMVSRSTAHVWSVVRNHLLLNDTFKL